MNEPHESIAPAPSKPAVAEWLGQVWRPAGSMSLSERWLQAGQPRAKPLPPPPPRARRKP